MSGPDASDTMTVTGTGPAVRLAAVSAPRSRDRRGPRLGTGPDGVYLGPLAGQPGHGSTAHLRRQPVRIVDGRAEGGYTGMFELICPDCGDRLDLEYSEVPARLQWLRGPRPLQAGLAAFHRHLGLAWSTETQPEVIRPGHAQTGPVATNGHQRITRQAPSRARRYDSGATMSEVTEQQLEDMEALFVQTAASMTSDRGTITLHGLSPSTLYFGYRPQRDVGHMTSDHFVANWAAGDSSFADNPPNAVLSFAESGDRHPEDAIVVIQDPHLDGDTLTYSIELLDGTLPAATGPCALFIDPFGRSLSPVSAAGMHRRERPRTR